MPARFDARAAWAGLTDAQRGAIGEMALLLIVSSDANTEPLNGERSADEFRIDRRWERAETEAWRRLADLVPIDFVEFADGPELSALGIRACRECGCTDEYGCPDGCWWIGPDLCSACGSAEAA